MRWFVKVWILSLAVMTAAGAWAIMGASSSATARTEKTISRSDLRAGDADAQQARAYVAAREKLMHGEALTAQEKSLMSEVELRHQTRPGPVDNTGGPDGSGYAFMDNVAPDTATFNWIELCADDSASDGPTGDDVSSGSIPIGFSFPFYGNNYTSCFITTNGLITFNTENTTYTASDPTTSVPTDPYIAPFWFDGNTGGTYLGGCNQDASGPWIRYRSFGTYFVVEWKKMPQYVEPDYATFEAILYLNGKVKVQFGGDFVMPTIPGDLGNVGVGIDGTGANDGLRYAFWPHADPWIGYTPTDSLAIWFVLPNGIPNPVTNLQGSANGLNVTLTWVDPNHDTNGNPQTPDSILIYRGNTQQTSQIGHVAHGVQSFSITESQGNITYYVRAKAGTWTGPTTNVTVVVGTPGYANNFDLDNGGWVSDNGGWTWGAPTNAQAPTPHSGTNMWGTGMNGNYGGNLCTHMDLSPNLSVLSTNATLEFWAWWSMYPFGFYDGCNVKVSVDGGTTWDALSPQDGYGGVLYTFNTCLPSDSAWSETSNGWRYIVMPIGQYVNQIPIFRFTFGSYLSGYPGFFVDDMTIWGIATPPNGIPRPPTNFQGSAGGTTTVNFTWTDPTQDTNGNPLTLDSILIYRGDNQPASQIGHAAAGAQTLTISGQPVGNIHYFARAKATTYTSLSVTNTVLVGNPGYNNNFETDNGGWVSDGSWSWGAPTNPAAPQPHSGTNMWGTGMTSNYPGTLCDHLDLDPGLQINSPNATVEFWGWWSMYPSGPYDGVNFKVSVDGGVTWQAVSPLYRYFTQPMYSFTRCMPNDSAWTENSNGWHYVVIPVGQFNGQTPIFRFTIGTYLSGYAGFFFDDMTIWGIAPPPNGIPRVVTNLAGSANGRSVTLTWTDPNHDTNNNPLTPDSILIYRTTSQPASQIGHVAHGVQTITIANEPEGHGLYYVRAKAGQYISLASSVQLLVGSPTYNNGFDIDDGALVGTPGWQWGPPTNPNGPQAHSAPNVWAIGLNADYTVTQCDDLDVNLGLVVQSPSASVEFWAWYYVEPGFDGVNFRASTDEGASWQILHPSEHRYDVTTYTGTSSCISGDSAWSGQSTGWVHITIPIGTLQGEAPIFRFKFGSDASVDYRGFYIDDLIIWGLQPPRGANVSGTVSLSGGHGNVTQTMVTGNGLGNPSTNPAANGSYTLANVQVGNRIIMGSLANYLTDTMHIVLDTTGHTGVNLVLRRVPPPAPVNLVSIVLTSARKDSLHWTMSPDTMVDGYRIYRKLSTDPNFTFRKNIWGRTTVWGRDTLEADGVYDYVITAADTNMLAPPWSESAVSDTATSPFGHIPPINLTADGNFDSHIHLAWNAPSDLAESYFTYDNGVNEVEGIGWWGGEPTYGWLVAHYQGEGPVTVKGVRAYFTRNAVLGSPIEVGVFADDGMGHPAFTPLATLSGTVDAPLNAMHEWTLDSPVTIDNGSFYVGIRQMSDQPICLGGENATPFVTNTFFYSFEGRAWSSWEPDLLAVPMLSAHVVAVSTEDNGTPAPLALRKFDAVRKMVPATGFLTKTSPVVKALTAPASGKMAAAATPTTTAGTFGGAKKQGHITVPFEGRTGRLAWQRAERLAESVGPHAPVVLAAESSHGRAGRTLDDIIRYIILRDNVTTAIDSVLPSVFTYDNINVPENQSHNYWIKARYDDNGLSPASNMVTAMCNMAPGAPTNPTATPVGTTQMRINWTDPTVNADGTPCVDLAGLRVYRDGTLITTTPVAPGVHQYTDTPPDPSVVYTWTVKAIDEVPNESAGATTSGSVISPWHTVDYNWVDITSIGTICADGDDINSGPLDIGFPFTYYGNTYTSVNVCSNGWISFTDQGTIYYEQCPLDNTEPLNCILGFGADLWPTGGQCKYYADAANQRFIVSFDHSPHCCQDAPPYHTFQIILDPNGGITIQFGAMDDTNGIVAVKNLDGSDIITLWCQTNGPFTPSGSNAVQFWGGPRQSIQGTVQHNGGSHPPLINAQVWVTGGTDTVMTDDAGHYVMPVDPGTYTVNFRHPTHCDTTHANVVVQPNIADTVDMRMNAPNATLNISSLTFVVHRYGTQQQPFTITNSGGTCPLTYTVLDSVSWLTSNPATGTVAPNGVATINVSAAPQQMQPGEYSTTMRVLCNAPGSPFLIQVDMNVLSVEPLGGGLPTVFALHQNYPNPFNPTTLLPFDVPQTSQVDIVVYNVMGQEVSRPVSGKYSAGRYQASFAAGDLPSGVYLAKMTAGNFHALTKIMLLK